MSAFTQLIDKFIVFLGRPRKKANLIAFAIVSIVALAYAAGAAAFLWDDYKVITREAYERKALLARLSQEIIDRNFDAIITSGKVIAHKASLQSAIRSGNTVAISRILQGELEANLKFVERLLIADEDGTIIGDSRSPSDVFGVNFAYRDWYKGAIEKKGPHVSELFVAASIPYLASTAVVVPIIEDSVQLGMLVMQVPVENLFQWVGQIELRKDEVIFFADKNGIVASHPLFPYKNLVDLSFYEPVQRSLRGERGAEIAFNSLLNEEYLVAYEPLGRNGFSAYAVETTDKVFAERGAHIFTDSILFVVSIFGIIGLGIISFYVFFRMNEHFQREKSLMEGIGDGFFAVNRDHLIEIFNAAAERLSGWKKEEAIGKPMEEVFRVIRVSDRKENLEFIEKAMHTRSTQIMEDKSVLIRKDGTELLVGDSAAPVIDLNGRVSGAVVIFRDISKEVESKAIHSDFAHASHQLRTPITKILWSLESLAQGKLKKDQKERVDDAAFAAKSLGKLSDQLLAITEIDQKIKMVQREKVEVVDVLKSIIEELGGEAKQMRVKVETYFTGEELMAAADGKALYRALYEVIENAIIYNKDGGRVDIKASTPDDQIVVEIEDTGLGIPEKEQAIIFSKFFRGSNIPKDSIGGGLGLYIAKAYITLMGGKIWFSSEENKGTRFSVLLSKWTG